MNKLVSGAISSICAYLSGIFFNYLNVQSGLPEYLIDPAKQAMRETVTYYLSNASFIVGISVGCLTAYFLIKNNLKRESKNDRRINQTAD